MLCSLIETSLLIPVTHISCISQEEFWVFVICFGRKMIFFPPLLIRSLIHGSHEYNVINRETRKKKKKTVVETGLAGYGNPATTQNAKNRDQKPCLNPTKSSSVAVAMFSSKELEDGEMRHRRKDIVLRGNFSSRVVALLCLCRWVHSITGKSTTLLMDAVFEYPCINIYDFQS